MVFKETTEANQQVNYDALKQNLSYDFRDLGYEHVTATKFQKTIPELQLGSEKFKIIIEIEIIFEFENAKYLLHCQAETLGDAPKEAGNFNVEITEHLAELNHREIYSEYLRNGLGSQMLNTCEHELQGIVNMTKKERSMFLWAGQPKLWEWMMKRGYSVHPNHLRLYQETIENPEKYYYREKHVKDFPYLYTKADNSEIRIVLYKTLSPQESYTGEH